MATYTPTFSQVILFQLNPGELSSPFTVTANTIWKIESVGIGGTKGAVYLTDSTNNANNLAILFSSTSNDDYGSRLPFTLPAGFTGKFRNDSLNKAIISVTEYQLV